MDKIKVLMVDDEAQFRETTSKILMRRGYETTVAGSGEEALQILKKESHDVVVLDIKMPGMDGHQALAEIRKVDPNIQVIMLTGHGQLQSAKESWEKGAFDYLSKPCDIDRLSSRIQDAYNISHKVKREEKNARDLMIPLADYTTLHEDQSVKEGIEALQKSFMDLMATSRIMQTGHRSILILDKRGELVGVLSIRDLIAGIRPGYLSAPRPSTAGTFEYSRMFWTGLFTKQAKDLAKKKVSEIMSDPPQAVDENANLMEIANYLYESEERRVVVTRQGKVVGVIREQEIFFELANIILGN